MSDTPKEAKRKRDRVYRETHREEIRAKQNSRYHQPRIHEQRLARAKEYRGRPGIKERGQVYKQEYYSQSENKEKKSKSDKDWRERPENRERLRTQHHDSHKARSSDPEYKEHMHNYFKTYYSQPEVKERYHSHNRNRRARKRNAVGIHTAQQIQDLLKRQKYTCYYCATKFQQAKGKYIYHVDHTFPLSRVVGTDIPANDISYLVLACPRCNLSKHNKFPHEFFEGGRLL